MDPTNSQFLHADSLFDVGQFEHRQLFQGLEYPWLALTRISEYIQSRLTVRCEKLIGKPYIEDSPQISIGEGTIVEEGAMIKAPALIGRNCEIRNGAYIRGNVIVGDGCVVGNSTELKNCILMNNVQVPHFNYVGDSILGNYSHLGAGVILSNVRLDCKNVSVQDIDTGLMKLGGIMGDHVEVGCNSVINPGSVIGRNSVVYPGSVWKGVLPSDSILKTTYNNSIVNKVSK